MRILIWPGLALVLSAASFVTAQNQAAQRFEVASVKPAVTKEVGGTHRYPGGRISFRGCTLYLLLEQAFNLRPFQLSGGPQWSQDERYDIEAKPVSGPAGMVGDDSRIPLTLEQREMLRGLLIERFHLKYRLESREAPVYLLVRDKGTKLQMTGAKDKTAFPWSGSLRGGMIQYDGLAGKNENMPDLAERLSRYVERPVLDRTDLEGSFDFRCEYHSDEPRPDVITVITSCLHDLGLKLEPSRGQVEHLTIESVQKPSPN